MNLRGKDFLTCGGHAWFEKYACPDCYEKGERSTLSDSICLSPKESEDSDLNETAKLLWGKVLEASDTTPRAEWICNMAMMSVQSLDDGKLKSNYTNHKVRGSGTRWCWRSPLISYIYDMSPHSCRPTLHNDCCTYI